MKKLIIEISEENGKCEYLLTTRNYDNTTTFTTTEKRKEDFTYFEIIGMIENVKQLIISKNK